MNWLQKHWEAIAIGGVSGILVAVIASRSKSTVASTTTTPGSATLPPPFAYTLVSGQDAFDVQARVGQTITISLPAGGSWTGQAPNTSVSPTPLTGSAPVSWVFQGPGQVVWTWIDAAQMPQTTVGTFDLVPNSMGA